MAAAERREVGPVVGVGPLGGRRVVRRREVVLDGPRQLGHNGSAGSAPFERLDRGQRVPASGVSGERADLGAVRGRFHAHFFRRKESRLPRLRMAGFSSTAKVALSTE